MTAFQYAGGEWQACEGLPLEDRAFRYGMSFFETVAVVGGRPLFWAEHWLRLKQAAAGAGGYCPADCKPPDLLMTGVLRLYLTAGPGNYADLFLGHLFGLFESCDVGTFSPPVSIATCSAPYAPRPGGWKTGNYWQNVDALCAARRMSCDEALLFNVCGALVSASMANVFLKLRGQWVTPALETGARDGVVRAWLLGHLAAEESLITPEDVAVCSECILTNSRTGLRAVKALDGRALTLPSPALADSYYHEILCS